MIIIWCTVPPPMNYSRLSALSESLEISITVTESFLLIFFALSVEKLHVWLGIEPTTLDLCSLEGVYDSPVTATPDKY